MTLLSDLTTLLLPAVSRDLRERGVAGELDTEELISISRFLDVAAAVMGAPSRSSAQGSQVPESLADRARASAAADRLVIDSIRRTRA